MSDYEAELSSEKAYLEKTVSVIKKKLDKELAGNLSRKKGLTGTGKEMWEDTAHHAGDFDRLIDISQYLSMVSSDSTSYRISTEKIGHYKKLLDTPYFARVDFSEDGYDTDKIYIGIAGLADEKTYDIYIYDWRAPICSIFYRYELGDVSYMSPTGIINGKVSLKRQYDIRNGNLNSFIDSGLIIIDDVLRTVLSKNTSSKMKSIVETIQRQQDIIIRDMENELLIVQGAAGSGKTSVAMHRIAYLMYRGLKEKLFASNIVIISPNDLFGLYISNVLPELGEENISRITFENIFERILGQNFCVKSRNELLEQIICAEGSDRTLIKGSLDFKLSGQFKIIMDNFIHHFEHKMIQFSDINYNGKCIASRNLLKSFFLKNDISLRTEQRLKTIQARILEAAGNNRKERMQKLTLFASRYPQHQFELKAFARLLSIKESTRLKREIEKFTEIDYFKLYKSIFKNKDLFYRLSDGIDIPEEIESIRQYTLNCLESEKCLNYDDAIAMLYLKVKMCSCDLFNDIRQTLVDEAQDYYAIQYEILKELFPNARFTVLGDVNQTIEKSADISVYQEITTILGKKKHATVFMNKSFRCSYEITRFSRAFLNEDSPIESFDRHGEAPIEKNFSDYEQMITAILNEIEECKKLGFGSIGVICKSLKRSNLVFEELNTKTEIGMLEENTEIELKGAWIMPVYLAKGLEFDAVIILGTEDYDLSNKEDKRLMYISSTRALHSCL